MAQWAADATDAETTLPAEEGRELIEREALRLLGMGGDEFMRRWSARTARTLRLPEAPIMPAVAQCRPSG